MKFVFLCDASYLKGDLAAFVNNFPTNHELVTMTAEEFLQAKCFPEGTFGVLVERFTWQKNFSLFRYFGLLPILEVLPLRGSEIVIVPSASPEELFTMVDKFVAAPPPGHVYPRGCAKV
jgi:hypothetical protein